MRTKTVKKTVKTLTKQFVIMYTVPQCLDRHTQPSKNCLLAVCDIFSCLEGAPRSIPIIPQIVNIRKKVLMNKE